MRVGYQWNGNSILAGDPTTATGYKASLPSGVLYSAGVDVRVTDRITLASDLIGESVLSASRLSLGSYTDVFGNVVPAIQSYTGDYSSDAIGVGIKARVKGQLIVVGNLTTRIDSAGLRALVVPLIGASYAF